MTNLLALHQYCRPHGSISEKRFINQYIAPHATPDSHGNYHHVIGTSQIMWSCHIDTTPCVYHVQHKPKRKWKRSLHRYNTKEIRHNLYLDKGILRAHQSHCGADNSAGVFLSLEMIKRRIPGHYVFHRGEERGCIGSQALAYSCPAWLTSLSYAIALDRRGTSDIITHQFLGRTASDAFAESLADQLNSYAPFNYRASSRGSFTDTNEYQHLIPECSNISVGYSHEHTKFESLDTDHLLTLLEALCQVKEKDLVCKRDPADSSDDCGWYGNLHSLSMFCCVECEQYKTYDRYGCMVNGRGVCTQCIMGTPS